MFNRSALPYVWMLSGALSFACMGALAHALEKRCDWLVVAMARTALALVFAWALARTAKVKLVWRRRTLWIRSLAGSVSLVCTFFALPRMPVGDVLTLTNVFPLWVALLSWPVLSEAPTPQLWLSLAAGLAGVALVEQPHFAEGNFAAMAALASSVSTAVAMLGLHRLQDVDPRAIVVHFSAVGLFVCLMLFPRFAGPTPARGLDDPTTLLILLGIGLTATVGQVMLTKAFAAGPAAKVSVTGLSQVVFGVVFDRLFWGRSFDPLTILGMALVLAPTAWLMLRRDPESAPLAGVSK
ncbi:MAG TPA: DMT family transporter [Pirellulales bacterium]|nr:DMT family transporter [Pirellulales bacterium]